MMKLFLLSNCLLLPAIFLTSSTAFLIPKQCGLAPSPLDSIDAAQQIVVVSLAKISRKRRDQLGIGEKEDEYDLEMALDQNTDPLITKLIAGSLIIAILAGLVVGVVIPATTDYGDLCNPLLSGGRC